MSFSEKFIRGLRTVLPNPFTIAILLTILVFVVALFGTKPAATGIGQYSITLLDAWNEGLWGVGGLAFAVQMMLMLVLGHVLAITRPVNNLIHSAARFCNSTASAALIVTALTVLVSLFNWGLGLIFGAIFARKVAERASAENIPLHYPLIAAAGYSGLMVWHGGVSGSALIKVAEKNAIPQLMEGGSIEFSKNC